MFEIFTNTNYLLGFFNNVAFLILLGLSLNIIMGYVGYLNLGHVGFWAIGSYTYTILLMQGHDFFVCLFAGAIAAAIAGLILGLPTLKLRSHYIGIASLGFTYIVHSLSLNLTDITRGPLGIPGIPRPTIFGISFQPNHMYFLLSWAVTIVSGIIIYRLLHSPWGKILETIREDQVAAKTLGKNIFLYKIQAFIISAFFAGIAAGIYSSFYQYIGGTNSFFIPQLLLLLTIVMLGGAGSFWGSVVGAVIVWIMYEGVRFLPIEAGLVGPVQQATYASVLVLIMIFRPRGIMGKNVKILQK